MTWHNTSQSGVSEVQGSFTVTTAERRRPSLAGVLSLFIAGAAVVSLAGIGGAVYVGVGSTLANMQERSIEQQMRYVRQRIETFLDYYIRALQDTARLPILIQGAMQPEAMGAPLADFMGGLFFFGNRLQLSVLDYRGRLIHASQAHPQVDYEGQAWVKDLTAGTRTQSAGIYKLDSGYFWRFAVPIRFNENVEGILVGQLPFSAVGKTGLQAPGPTKIETRIEFLHGNQLIDAYGPNLGGDAKALQFPDLNLVLRFFWDRSALGRARAGLLLQIFVALSCLSVLILAAARLAANRYVLKPLEVLRSLTHAIATGNRNEAAPADFSLQELHSLSTHFNLMADKIKARELSLENEVRERKEAEAALLTSEQRFRTLVEYAPEAIVVVDLEKRRFVDANQNAIDLFGYPREDFLKLGPLEVSPPMQADGHPSTELASKYLHSTATGGAPVFEWIHCDASGHQFPCEVRLVGLPGKGRKLFRGSITDITEKKRIQEALYAEKERAQVTLHSIGDAVISTDAQGRVDFLNPMAEGLTGWQAAAAKGRLLADVFRTINEETGETAEDPVARCLKQGKIVSSTSHTVLVSRSGKQFSIEDSAAPIANAKGDLLGVVLVFKDVTEARNLSRQISYQAAHDSLTGLINRAEFDRRLRRVLETARAESTENALAYLDLDQFKLVNDTCGHVAGDELLRQVGQLLTRNIRKRDTLARLGGDEFGLLMEHCSIMEAKGVADNLVRAIGEFTFPWEEQNFNIGVSIGLASVVRESSGVEGILSAADSACYLAKDQGRNRVHLHQENDAELLKRHGEMQWAVRLPKALEEDRFVVYFQVIAPTHRPKVSQPSHYELLLRMKDETGKLILPDVFLSAGERYNLSEKLDRWMIHRAFRWLRAHPAHLTQLDKCSINLSGLSLSNSRFGPYVIQELEDTGIPPEKICFEITETVAIANLSSATRFIKTLRERGCCFALDDFGSGLSSFAYLKNLPVDFLKIDGLFVKDITSDPMDLAMVKSINDIGHVMGKRTIAESVESNRILKQLIEIGVDYVQGYHIGPPRPLDAMLAYPKVDG